MRAENDIESDEFHSVQLLQLQIHLEQGSMPYMPMSGISRSAEHNMSRQLSKQAVATLTQNTSSKQMSGQPSGSKPQMQTGLTVNDLRGASRSLHINDLSDTLKEELERFPEVAISFNIRLSPCVSHFYHMIMNAALPIYAKLIRPFAKEGKRPPRRTVYVSDVGGTIEMLRQVLPEFEFVFVPWVPRCCPVCLPSNVESYAGQVPLFVLHSDGIGLYRNESYSPPEEHRQLIWDFRDHILERMPEAQDPWRHIYVTRNEAIDFVVEQGEKLTGCEKRCLSQTSEQQLVQAMNDTAAGIHVVGLDAMPFEKQVQIHREASVVVGLHGAAFVHCLWMPLTSSIIEINSQPSLYIQQHFRWLCNDILGLERRFYEAVGNKTNMVVNASSFMSEHIDLLG